MATQNRNKLYFDVNFLTGTVGAARIFPCTQFRSTRSYTGDMYGSVLADLPPVNAASAYGDKTSQVEQKRSRDVSAWFVPQIAVGTGALGYGTAFVNATTITPGTPLAVTGGLAGSTSIYTRHFAVLVRNLGVNTARGRLYVQRQHSIEV